PLAEQRRIVGILDEAFAGIATATTNAQKNLANARELFDSELNAVFAAYPGESLTPLGNVAQRVTVGHVGTTSRYYCDDGIPFLRTQNVGEGELELAEFRSITPEFHQKLKKSSLRPGDVL